MPESAKVVLVTPSLDEVLKFTTPEGIPNTLGGRIEKGETPQQARDREKHEELSKSVLVWNITPRPIGVIEGTVKNGETRRWHVFAGLFQLSWFNSAWDTQSSRSVPVDEIPEPDEIASMQVESIATVISLDEAKRYMFTRAVDLVQRSITENPNLFEQQSPEQDDHQRLAG